MTPLHCTGPATASRPLAARFRPRAFRHQQKNNKRRPLVAETRNSPPCTDLYKYSAINRIAQMQPTQTPTSPTIPNPSIPPTRYSPGRSLRQVVSNPTGAQLAPQTPRIALASCNNSWHTLLHERAAVVNRRCSKALPVDPPTTLSATIVNVEKVSGARPDGMLVTTWRLGFSGALGGTLAAAAGAALPIIILLLPAGVFGLFASGTTATIAVEP